MKPIIIYQGVTQETVTLPKDKFEELIREAYEEGVKDGKRDTQPVWYQPTAIPTYLQPAITTPCTTPQWWHVTCAE